MDPAAPVHGTPAPAVVPEPIKHLAAMLACLSEHGVTVARFDPNGILIEVRMGHPRGGQADAPDDLTPEQVRAKVKAEAEAILFAASEGFPSP